MVVRAYGTANGQKIILANAGGDRWTAEVPFNEDGEYIVELFAEDEAGNTGYMCTVLFVVSGHRMHAYIVPRGYEAQENRRKYILSPVFEKMRIKLQRIYFRVEPKEIGFGLEVREGGYTVEHAVCRTPGS